MYDSVPRQADPDIILLVTHYSLTQDEDARKVCIEPGAVKTEFAFRMRSDIRNSIQQLLANLEQARE
jgi:hypothetical protein